MILRTRARKMTQWLLCVLSPFAMPAHAARVATVQVTRDGARFLINMHLDIDASPRAVFRALQDYGDLARNNPDLRSARVEPTATAGRVRLFTTIHTCVLIFCKTMHQEQIMTATASADGGELDAQLVPGGGDFKSGHGLWIVGPCPTARDVSCLDIRIELVPAFWVPPVIGSWVIRAKMNEEARRTAAGLERTARRFIR